ncbi:MAG: winged helix-turn-helix transcriptional regulator [Clostridia bacterium]|nr:winged helix-turn-helix transcriptional regulator [Clostridia bacterium]
MNGVLKIVTRDVFLGQKLYRELSSRFSHVEIAENPSGTADLWLFDTRTHKPEADAPQFFYLAADTKALPEERTLPLPLPIGLAEKMLGQKKASPLILLENERALRLYGRQIKLTEVEYALLRAIVEADGAFISREALKSAVWGAESSEGVLNVYIHYLREKLERDGEKVILSSRKSGYALAEKFKRGSGAC